MYIESRPKVLKGDILCLIFQTYHTTISMLLRVHSKNPIQVLFCLRRAEFELSEIIYLGNRINIHTVSLRYIIYKWLYSSIKSPVGGGTCGNSKLSNQSDHSLLTPSLSPSSKFPRRLYLDLDWYRHWFQPFSLCCHSKMFTYIQTTGFRQSPLPPRLQLWAKNKHTVGHR